MLTQFAVQKAAPADKPYKVFDGNGLFLLVKPNGKKLWRFRYHFAGKENLLAFGSYPEITLASARRKRDEARRLIAEGIDPSLKPSLLALTKIEVARGDEKTALTIHSLYQRATIAPPDSLLRDVDVVVVDLQDIGTRTWTYVGIVLYAMKASVRRGIPIVVLDRPNPISGARTEGALLDSGIANPNESTPERIANGFSLFPMPLRHGLTMGELARLFQEQLKVGARLTVVPMRNWRRQMWFDDTQLPWVRPSPNMPNLTSAVLYPALVPFEASNVSVGRGTNEPFQRFGASWMRADTLVRLLEDLSLSGVRFRSERFTPNQPGDGKFAGQSIPGVRIEVTDRDLVQPGRIGAAILWALSRTQRDSLKITAKGFDERMGSARVREQILSGADPDAVMDRQLPGVVAFERDARKIYLYR